MKNAIVGLKELRENMEEYINQIGKGKSFTVVRRSKPVFNVTPVADTHEQDVAQASMGIIKRYKKALDRLADA